MNQITFNLSKMPIINTAIVESTQHVIDKFSELGESPHGLIIDNTFCDFTTKKGFFDTSELADIISEAAFQLEPQTVSEKHLKITDYICEQITKYFETYDSNSEEKAIAGGSDDGEALFTLASGVTVSVKENAKGKLNIQTSDNATLSVTVVSSKRAIISAEPHE